MRKGNEAVLQARFEDAIFFYENDKKLALKDHRPKLAGTAFQKELGSMLDKADRVESLVSAVAKVMNLEEYLGIAVPAAHLCKADLVTSMVMEMTSLSGIMGKHYAFEEGQSAEVAQAIFESVLPRHAGDELPSSMPGNLISIADKLDSLVGLFAAGCAPTATADPYGLRRSAVGLLQILCGNDKLRIDLVSAIDVASTVQPINVDDNMKGTILEFLQRRLEQMLVDDNVQIEAIRASLSERGNDPYLAALTAREINAEMSAGEAGTLHQVMAAMARPMRLTRNKDIEKDWKPDPTIFEHDEEQQLYEKFKQVSSLIHKEISIQEFLRIAEELIIPLDAYFEKVFVMCDNESLRRGRLALLRDIALLTNGIIDFSELPGF